MIKLSVIVPHYNWPERLEILLDTIPNRPDVQVIVVDDNSDKDIEKLELIKEKYSNRNVLFFKNHFKNRSAGACRNIGLEYAQGEWILFADADDYFLPDWYEKVSRYFETNSEMIFFPPTSIQLNTNGLSSRHKVYEKMILDYLNRHDFESELRLRYFYSSPCSKLIRQDLIKKNNIRFEEIMVSNDVMFSVKCGHYANSLECSQENIYVVTESGDSLTCRKNKAAIDMRNQTMIRRGEFFFRNLDKEKIRQLSLQSYGASLLYETIRQGYIDLVWKYIWLLRKAQIPILNFEILRSIIKKKCSKFIKKEK